MVIHETLCRLGYFLDGFEKGDNPAEVSLCECDGFTSDGQASAIVELTIDTESTDDIDIEFADTQTSSDGTPQAILNLPNQVADTDEWDGSVEARGVTLNGDGSLSYRLEVSVPTDPDQNQDQDGESMPYESGEESGRSDCRNHSQHGKPQFSDDRAEEPPAFKNPQLLREVYASCETFDAMADEIEMDVTAETVRRYMIDHDIHQPNSYDTSPPGAARATSPESEPTHSPTDTGPNDEETPGEEMISDAHAMTNDGTQTSEESVVLADGIGLPDSVNIDALIETIRDSSTIYEVKQGIDVDRDDALELLRELNLLDLVVGRLATESERDVSRSQIIERLRDASAVRQPVAVGSTSPAGDSE